MWCTNPHIHKHKQTMELKQNVILLKITTHFEFSFSHAQCSVCKRYPYYEDQINNNVYIYEEYLGGNWYLQCAFPLYAKTIFWNEQKKNIFNWNSNWKFTELIIIVIRFCYYWTRFRILAFIALKFMNEIPFQCSKCDAISILLV